MQGQVREGEERAGVAKRLDLFFCIIDLREALRGSRGHIPIGMIRHLRQPRTQHPPRKKSQHHRTHQFPVAIEIPEMKLLRALDLPQDVHFHGRWCPSPTTESATIQTARPPKLRSLENLLRALASESASR